MKKELIYIIPLTALFFMSCQKIFHEDSRVIYPGNFNSVRFSGMFDIILIQDSLNKVVLTGTDEIHSIEANVINDTLIIENTRNPFFKNRINKLSLHFSNLEYMVTYDPVNVSNEDTINVQYLQYDAIGEIAEVNMVIKCNYLSVYNSANTLGYIYISGRADGCTLFNRYGSSIYAGSLVCRDAEIINESAGDVCINATENLKVYLWGPGNIYYYGNPAINIREKRGEGKLIPL